MNLTRLKEDLEWLKGSVGLIERDLNREEVVFDALRDFLKDVGACPGLLDVLDERRGQVEKGFTAGHDDGHELGELAVAASCYALSAKHRSYQFGPPAFWPWSTNDWKPESTPREDLVKSAALALAQVARIDRMTNRLMAKGENHG